MLTGISKRIINKFYSVVCTVHVYELLAFKLVQHYALNLRSQTIRIATCFRGGYYHHEGRQHQKPKNTATRSSLRRHAQIAVIRAPCQHRTVYGTPSPKLGRC